MTEQKTEEKVRMRGGLKEYTINNAEDFLNMEGGTNGIIKILRKMSPNQYFIVRTIWPEIEVDDLRNTNGFQRYLEKLREHGLDVGRGEAEYGFKMPLPKNGELKRKLIVFRRWKDD